MKTFFSSLRRYWQEARKRRRYAEIIEPACIGSMAKELEHLAQIVMHSGNIPPTEVQYLQQLHKEMEKLISLTENNAFKRLPADRRVTLYYSLRRSHERLITSIQDTESPTMRMQ